VGQAELTYVENNFIARDECELESRVESHNILAPAYLTYNDPFTDVEPDSERSEGSCLQLAPLSDHELYLSRPKRRKDLKSQPKPRKNLKGQPKPRKNLKGYSNVIPGTNEMHFDNSWNDDSSHDPDYLPEEVQNGRSSMEISSSDSALRCHSNKKGSVEMSNRSLVDSNIQSKFGRHFSLDVSETILSDVDAGLNRNVDKVDHNITTVSAIKEGILLQRKRVVAVAKKQTWDKCHYCTFCEKGIVGKIQRHLVGVHDNEQVNEIKVLPKQSKERSVLLQRLINDGNYKHNIKVMKAGEGQLVVGRRSEVKGRTASQYTVCVYCRKWLLKSNLWNHVKTSCKENPKRRMSNSVEDNGKKPRVLAMKRGQSFLDNVVYANEDNLNNLESSPCVSEISCKF